MKMITGSPHDKLPILEEGWHLEMDNKISVLKRIEKPSRYSQFLEFTKLILYLELIFFIGLVGCSAIVTLKNGNSDYEDSQTKTSNACGASMIDCTPSDINNRINHDPNVMKIRDKRSSDEDELKLANCQRNMNATRDKISHVQNQFIPGDDSDTNTMMLREACHREIMALVMRVMLDKLVTNTTMSSVPTDEQWHSFALEIKSNIINKTGEEYREKVESSGSPTEEMVTDLRNAVESMIRDYRECERIIDDEEPSTEPTIGDALNDRGKCEMIATTLLEDARPVIVQIIPGDSSDRSIVELRQKVGFGTLMGFGILVDYPKPSWNIDMISERVGNLTNEGWRELINSVRDEAVGSSSSAQRQQLETDGPITEEMINTIRTWIQDYLPKLRNCAELKTRLNNFRAEIEARTKRIKRDSDSTSEHGVKITSSRTMNAIQHLFDESGGY